MKTKLGISAGAVAAIAYLAGFFSGYVVLLLIVGYVFIAEDNDWLKTNTLKALALTLCFGFATQVLRFIPDLITLTDSLFRVWGGNFSIAAITRIISFLVNILGIAEKVLMLVLGVMALGLKSINLGGFDNFVQKHILKKEA